MTRNSIGSRPAGDRQQSASTERMRVLSIIARLNVGGPAYHVSVISGRLDSQRYETLLAGGDIGPGEASLADEAARQGARLHSVPHLHPEVRPVADVRALLHLVRLIRRFRPDIVDTHTAKAGLLGRTAAILSGVDRPVIVHTFHGHVLRGYFGPAKTRFYRTLERLLARFSDALIGVSEATVVDLVDMGVAPRAKFRTIHHGLDLEHFLSVDRSEGGAFREELGVDASEILLTYVGRLVPIKRVDVLLKALALLRSRGVAVRLAIVGDGELRGDLQGLAAKLGVSDTAHFLGYRRDLERVAAACDIAVLSSDSEGLPFCLIEAAAASRPLVATRVGGVPEIVIPDAGLLVPPGDHVALAAAVHELATDPVRRRRMGAAGRNHVRARYASDRLLRDVDRLFQELLSSRAGQTG